MSRIEVKKFIVTFKPSAPKQFKQQVGKLLNDTMRMYDISGSFENEKAFKEILKSNLYYAIDNYFNVKKEKKDGR